MPPTQNEALSLIAQAAVEAEAVSNVPALLTACQCILESGWLSKMPAGSNNPFGIKANGPGDGILAMTEEWFTDAELARFLALGGGRRAEPMGGAPNSRGRRRYIVHDYFCRFDTLADAFAHHNRLLIEHPAYRAAMEQFGQDGNMDRLMDGIAKHYATAGDYADVLRQIAAQDNVRQAIARARAEA